MKILDIYTCNEGLGVAITHDNIVIGEIITSSKQDHSTRLMPAIIDLMERTNIASDVLDAIVVAQGPGSYTGSRIGITTAKTMAWGLNIPIYTVSSLALLAMNGRLTSYYICPFFNARRGSVFTGLYKWEKNQVVEIEKERNIPMADWLQMIQTHDRPILFFSPHLDVFEALIDEVMGEHAIILDHTLQRPLPSNMHLMLQWTDQVRVHEAAPNYLRKTEAEANLLKKQKDEYNNG